MTQEIKFTLRLDPGNVNSEGKKAAETIASLGKTSQVSAAQTAAALRGVPAQFTDIVTSLQAGQNPLTVFLQQGGQLKDMFGGAGPAARALGGYIAGLVNPFTAAAAGAAVLGLAYAQGSGEADAYAKALITTGNAAGTTVGQMQVMADRISDSVGTQHAAAEALAAMAGTGKIAGDQLEHFSEVAMAWGKVTGESVDDVAKRFVDLGADPVNASIKLNETTHFLTESIYLQIKALDDQGKSSEAARVAQEAYAASLEQRSAQLIERLGYFERAWNGVKGAALSAWDAMMGIGRSETPESALAAARAKVSELSVPTEYGGLMGAENEKIRKAALAEANKKAHDLGIESSDAAKRAGNRAAEAKRLDARVAFDKLSDKVESNADKRKKAIADATKLFEASGQKDKSVLDGVIADINAKYKDPKGPKPKSGARGFAREQSAEVALANAEAASRKRAAADVIEAERAALERRQQMGVLGSTEYNDRILEIERNAGDVRLAEINAQIQAEEGRKTKTKTDETKKRAKLIELESTKAHEVHAQRLKESELEFKAEQALTAQIEARVAARDQEGTAYARRLSDSNASTALSQIQDPNARATAEVAAQVAELRRASREMQQKLTLEMELTLDEGQAAATKARIEEIADQTAESVRLAYAGLAEQIKPAWQKMLDGWKDTNKLIRDSNEQTMDNMVADSEQAFVTWVQTGKFSVKSLVDNMVAEFARLQYRKFLAAVDSTGSLFGGFAALFSGGAKTGGSPSAPSGQTPAGGWAEWIAGGGAAAAANGATFAGTVARFANGGAFTNQLVAGPTGFAYRDGAQVRRGLMGEAGPEAVVPLRAAGGGFSVDMIDRGGRRVGAAALARASDGRLSILSEGHRRFATGGVFSATAPGLARGGADASAAAVTINPVINIDSRTDQAAVRGEVRRGISDALREYTKAMASAKKRSGG